MPDIIDAPAGLRVREAALFETIGKILLEWGYIERSIDGMLDLALSFNRTKICRRPYASLSFENAVKLWCVECLKIDIRPNPYGVSFQIIKNRATSNRPLRNLLVHGSPTVREIAGTSYVECRTRDVTKTPYLSQTITARMREWSEIKPGIRRRDVKQLLQRMFRDIALIPWTDIERGAEEVGALYGPISDARLEILRATVGRTSS
jgi:hypothetical protein